MSTNKNSILRVFSSELSLGSLGSALALGLVLASGQAHAQGTPDTPPAATPPPAAVTAPLTDQQMDQIKKMIGSMPKIFEFDGYLRSGFAFNDKGGAQEAFQAPGAFSKY